MKEHEGKVLIGIDPGIVSCGVSVLDENGIHVYNMEDVKNYEPNNDFRCIKFVNEIVELYGGINRVRCYCEIYLPYIQTKRKLQVKQVDVCYNLIGLLGFTGRQIAPYEWIKALSTSRKGHVGKPSLATIRAHVLDRFNYELNSKGNYSRHVLDSLGILCVGVDLDRMEGLL